MRRYETPEGTPAELARWAWDALQRRTPGTLYALVVGIRSVWLVEAETPKCMRLERDHPEVIAGFFRASMNLARSGLTVADIEESIRLCAEAP